jgi:hypothetical protein
MTVTVPGTREFVCLSICLSVYLSICLSIAAESSREAMEMGGGGGVGRHDALECRRRQRSAVRAPSPCAGTLCRPQTKAAAAAAWIGEAAARIPWRPWAGATEERLGCQLAGRC